MPKSTPVTIEHALAAVNEMLEERAGAWAEVGPSTRLEDLGMDSVDLAELFMALEEAVGDPIDPRSADGVELVSDLTSVRTLSG